MLRKNPNFLTGKEMVDYIADYLKNIRNRRVLPNVLPGYMRHMIPDSAPQKGEDWNVIMDDVERVIMPGVSIINQLFKLYFGINRFYFISLWLILGNICRKSERSGKITTAVRHELFLRTFPL